MEKIIKKKEYCKKNERFFFLHEKNKEYEKKVTKKTCIKIVMLYTTRHTNINIIIYQYLKFNQY